MTDLPALNAMNAADFTAVLGDVFENAPWIATMARTRGPFGSIDALHAAMMEVITAAGVDRQLALLQAQPGLLPGPADAPATDRRTAAADQPSPAERARLATANTAYRARFGFPFILAAGDRDRDAMLAAIKARLSHTPDRERDIAIHELGQIARVRIDALITEDRHGAINVHVTDTVRGVAAEGMRIELFQLNGDRFRLLGQGTTGPDGQLRQPILQNVTLSAGLYEVLFHVATWRQAHKLPDGLYEAIPIRLRVTEGENRRMKVFLTLSPYGYSTFCGG